LLCRMSRREPGPGQGRASRPPREAARQRCLTMPYEVP